MKPQFLHLRLGRFFAALSGETSADAINRQPWRRALGQAERMATTLEMTARLDELAHRACHAIEWRSASEAWLDLGTGRGGTSPWAIADQLSAATKALLPVEVACGVAATKSASRAASALAAPSGHLVVLSGYESSILAIAAKSGAMTGERYGDAIDMLPFRPSLVPRAIVRSVPIERASDPDVDGHALAGRDSAASFSANIDALVRDARIGLNALGLIASTVRVQFAGSSGVKEAFATLADPTAMEDALIDTAQLLGRRVLASTSGHGHLYVSLAQLSAAQSQASLFGWRYDQASARQRRFA